MKLPSANPDFHGYLFSVVAATCFAFSLVLARYSYDYGVNVQTIMSVRFVLLVLLLLLWNLWRKQSLLLPGRLLAGCAALGLSYFIGIGAYLSSVAYLPVSLAVLIFYTFPVLVALLLALSNRRWPQPFELLALAIAFGGLVLALDVKTKGLSMTGVSLGLLASLCVSINMIGSGYLLKNMPTTVLSFYMALVTSALAIVATIVGGGLTLPSAAPGWWALATMLFVFFIAFMANYSGIRRIGALRASSVMNLEPVATIVIAVLLLNETFTGKQLAGACIVLAGILLAQWPKLRKLALESGG